MSRIIYDFGPQKRRVFEWEPMALAVELAVVNVGSVRAVCEALRISRNVLNRWRQGVRPRKFNLEALAECAGIPVAWLDPDPS